MTDRMMKNEDENEEGRKSKPAYGDLEQQMTRKLGIPYGES
jgi:hypothetical protein